jgi:NADPH:quinone reductase-like Zn-dependent oxidoreductase
VAGVIESIGNSVSQFKPGDKVFGYTKGITFGGCNAQYKTITEDRVVKMDESKISLENAVVLPIGGLTALYLLRMAKIEKEQKVLIYGASGSVGTFAVQLAYNYNADVTGVCSGKNMKLVQSIGASRSIDYTKEDFTKNGQTYDVIFDAVGKTTFAKCKNSLKGNGKYLTVEWPIFHSLLTSVSSKKKIVFGMAPHKAEDLIYLKELVEMGKLNPVIDRVFPLEKAVEAYTYVDKGHKVGNVVISI